MPSAPLSRFPALCFRLHRAFAVSSTEKDMRAWPLAIALACSAAALASSAVAETIASGGPLTLERVFGSPDLAGAQP
ncbi:hypothetical protein, partial [Escherichia coli]|uniref:hypothetical protein n=1 Tax=Escherichia coli TaxID=562 RepID=UPI003D00D19B